MATILCLETSSTNCSVAISKINAGWENDYHVKSCSDLIEDDSQDYSHGRLLHVLIDKILTRNNIQQKDLSAVAISQGPGSYTGLRIGASTAKGLAYALDIPLIAIDTLEALSLQDVTENRFVIPFLDARRMEVYSSVFELGKRIQEVEATILSEISFLRFRESGRVSFIGTGVQKFKDLLNPSSHNNCSFTISRPTALTMCDIAQEAYENKVFQDVAYFEPYYLKDFKVG
jgi:tRNA threonylcarbamoyladenosine biosynthesis protein TsaB